MRSFLVMALFVASFAGAPHQLIEEQREIQLPAGDRGLPAIETGSGSLAVNGLPGAATSPVRATVRLDERDTDEARRIIERHRRPAPVRRGDEARLVANGVNHGSGSLPVAEVEATYSSRKAAAAVSPSRRCVAA